jgi:uncharacterized membrane protein
MTDIAARRLVALLLLALAGSTAILVTFDVSTPIRGALTVAFACLVPGGAVVGALRLRSPAAEAALAMGTSLALCTLCAQAMVWARAWHPAAGLVALAALSVPLLIIQVARPDAGSPRLLSAE